MAVRNLVRAASIKGTGTPTSAPIRIDTSTNTPFYNGTGAGTSEVEIADVSSVQTLTNKTLTTPTIGALSGTVITNPQLNGVVEYNAAAGAVNAITSVVKSATGMADNTVVDFSVPCVITVPNANHAASVMVEVHASLGDQDSTEVSYWQIAISRIAGAAAKAVVSAKTGAANTAGAAGNAAATVSVAVAGGVGATNTINVQIKIARSAGAATNHDAIAIITLINLKASGVTIA